MYIFWYGFLFLHRIISSKISAVYYSVSHTSVCFMRFGMLVLQTFTVTGQYCSGPPTDLIRRPIKSLAGKM